jgi:hypothetical protein
MPFDEFFAIRTLSEHAFNLTQWLNVIQHQKKWRQKCTERAPEQYIASTVGSNKTTDCTRYNNHDKKKENRDNIISHCNDPPGVKMLAGSKP